MQQLEQEASELTEILTNVHNAQLHAEVMRNTLNQQGKDFVNLRIISRLIAIQNDIYKLLPPKYVRILRTQQLNDDSALQFRELKIRIMKMSPEQRDKLENFINEMG